MADLKTPYRLTTEEYVKAADGTHTGTTTIANVSATTINSVTVPPALGLVHYTNNSQPSLSGTGNVDIAYPGAGYQLMCVYCSYWNGTSTLTALQKDRDDGSYDNKWCVASSTTVRFMYNLPGGSSCGLSAYWCRTT